MKHDRMSVKPGSEKGAPAHADQDIEGILRSLRQNIKLTKEQQGAPVQTNQSLEITQSLHGKETITDAYLLRDVEAQNTIKRASRKDNGGSESGTVADADKVEASTKSESHVKIEHLIGLLASLQFATVVLITRVRLPTADGVESFVVFSMLFITAAHAKLHALLPSNDNIQQKRDAAIFILIVLPLYLFLAVAESWFLYYLFVVYTAESFSGFGNNAQTILTLAKILGVVKVIVVCSLLLIDPVRTCMRRRRWVKT